MPFMGGPMDGQEINPETLGQADQSGGLDLEALMAGMQGGEMGGAPPPPGGDPSMMGGPPPEEAGAEESLSESDRIQRVLEDLMALSAKSSAYTEQDKSGVQQAMSILQKIRANEEKMNNDALGGKIAPQMLSKQFAGATPGGMA